MKKSFKPSKQIRNDKTTYPTGEGKKEMKSPTRDSVTRNVETKMTTNGLSETVSWMDYPPEPPSASSVYSDWLLNVPNPVSRSSYEHLSIEIIRRLDYRLR